MGTAAFAEITIEDGSVPACAVAITPADSDDGTFALDPDPDWVVRTDADDPLNVKFAADMLNRLETLSNTTRGMFAETLVSSLLGDGVEVHPDPYGPWDLIWEDIRIQVKCSGERQTWHTRDTKPSPALWAAPATRAMNDVGVAVGERLHSSDVWIFARHTGYEHLRGWSFWVVPTHALAGGINSVTKHRLENVLGAEYVSVDLTDLARAVRAAANKPPARANK